MDPLYKKAIAQGVAGMAVFVAFIFLPAGTWHYWQGWLFIAVFSVSTIGFTVYLALYDRPLFERRMNAGPQQPSRIDVPLRSPTSRENSHANHTWHPPSLQTARFKGSEAPPAWVRFPSPAPTRSVTAMSHLA